MSIPTGKAMALLKRITGPRNLVVGDVMLGHCIWGDATRIAREVPAPVVDIARCTWTGGGAAASVPARADFGSFAESPR